MKTALIFFGILITLSSQSQIVQSTCYQDSALISTYQEDAKRMTVRRFYDNGNPYKDSIVIPTNYSDTILNALIAVHNAVSLSGRDTVVNILAIHTFFNPMFHDIDITADSNEVWMQQLKNNNFPTGNFAIDNLILDYNLIVAQYVSYPLSDVTDDVRFYTSKFLNMKAMSDYALTIPGIIYSNGGGWSGDGSDITSTIFSDRIELTYSYGWGDCILGCIKRRYWKFNVYNDCSVEYLGSYGSEIDFYVGLDEVSNEANFLFPNPAKDYLQISQEFINEATTLNCISSSGKKVSLKNDLNGKIDISHLDAGLYFFELRNEAGVFYQKIVVE